MKSAALPAIITWTTISRPSCRLDASARWATARCCWACPAAWIPRVCAALLSEAIGQQLTCVYVDHGLMRKGETRRGPQACSPSCDINFVCVDARERFLTKLAGVTDPEQKRKIIGAEFVRVFEDEAAQDAANRITWPRAPSTPT